MAAAARPKSLQIDYTTDVAAPVAAARRQRLGQTLQELFSAEITVARAKATEDAGHAFPDASYPDVVARAVEAGADAAGAVKVLAARAERLRQGSDVTDAEVADMRRQLAVGWLAQVEGEHAVAVLAYEDLLAEVDDAPADQQQALASLMESHLTTIGHLSVAHGVAVAQVESPPKKPRRPAQRGRTAR